MNNLSKEFWDTLKTKYPEKMDLFLKWIDEYKQKNNWDDLFNAEIYQGTGFYTGEAPKYHDLPMAMQIGIFLEYVCTQIMTTEQMQNPGAEQVIDDWFTEGYIWEFVLPFKIRKELANIKNLTRNDIVPIYTRLLKASHISTFYIADINTIILTKFKSSGLLYIKDKALKIINAEKKQKTKNKKPKTNEPN